MMKNDPTPFRRPVYLVVFGASAAVAIIMNVTYFQYDDVDLWARIICPLLIISGIYGSACDGHLLRLLGWLGIGIFLLCALQMVVPGEDCMSGGSEGPALVAPRIPSYLETGIRAAMFLTVTTVLIFSFWRLKTKR